MKLLIRIIPIILLSSTLAACSGTPTIVNMPVYTPPKFDMPIRPVLRSNGTGEVGGMTKNVELDLLDLKTYALQLENILIVIKSENTSNNK